MSLKSLTGVALAAVAAAGALTACDPTAAETGKRPNNAAKTVGGIPSDYLRLYKQAGDTCPGIDWALLAAIGKLESNHGQSTLPGVHSGANSAGAQGPMQFLPATWREVRSKHPGVGPNVYNPEHAVPAAAHYLCDSGASKNLRKAVWRYNHSNAYVNQVLAQADRYRNLG